MEQKLEQKSCPTTPEESLEQPYEKNNQILGGSILPQSVGPKQENGEIIGEQINLGGIRLITTTYNHHDYYFDINRYVSGYGGMRLITTPISPGNNQQVVVRGTNPVVYGAGNVQVSLEITDARVVKKGSLPSWY